MRRVEFESNVRATPNTCLITDGDAYMSSESKRRVKKSNKPKRDIPVAHTLKALVPQTKAELVERIAESLWDSFPVNPNYSCAFVKKNMPDTYARYVIAAKNALESSKSHYQAKVELARKEEREKILRVVDDYYELFEDEFCTKYHLKKLPVSWSAKTTLMKALEVKK